VDSIAGVVTFFNTCGGGVSQIAPKSVISSWKGEVLKWLPDLPEEEVCVPRKGTDAVFGTVRILSYDLVTNFVAK
jgi:SNF2 family DNA or RNA helicase